MKNLFQMGDWLYSQYVADVLNFHTDCLKDGFQNLFYS